MQEVWKSVVGYEGYYEVSNLGNVRSVDRIIVDSNGFKRRCYGKNIKLRVDHKGYLFVCLHNRRPNYFRVHRVVAMAFIPNLNNKPCINHMDENKRNNCVDNLAWVTRSENDSWGTKPVIQARRAKKQFSKPVIQFDAKMNPVKLWESATRASVELGMSYGGITQSCTKKPYKKTGGFYWRYAHG